jgi:hypothetical protein
MFSSHARKAGTPLRSPPHRSIFHPMLPFFPSLPTASHIPSSAAAESLETQQPEIPGLTRQELSGSSPSFSPLRVAPPVPGGGGDLWRRDNRSSRVAAAETPRAIPSKPRRTSRPRRRRDLRRRGGGTSWNLELAFLRGVRQRELPIRGNGILLGAASPTSNPPCTSCRSRPSAQKVYVW